MSEQLSNTENNVVKNVSVIIPCFNVQDFVADAVRSVLKDNAEHVAEIICVDNNSSDNTLSVLQQLNEENKIVRVESEEKKGACAARNKGLQLSTSGWIQFLDADDVLMPGKISKQLLLSIRNNNSNVAGAFMRRSVNGKETSFIPDENDWMGLFNTRFGVTSSLLLKRKDVLKAGGWNEELTSSQEYDLMFRMMKIDARFNVHDELLTLVRERARGQISQNNPEELWKNYLALRAEIFNYLENSRNEYFLTHRNEFTQAFFDLIRTVYPHAHQVAKSYFDKYIGKDFRPTTSRVSGKNYIQLHRLLGFPMADQLKNLFSNN